MSVTASAVTASSNQRTASRILTSALERMGVLGEGQEATQSELEQGMEILSEVLASLNNQYSFLDEVKAKTFNTVATDGTYPLPENVSVVKANTVYIRSDGVDAPLDFMRLEDYALIRDKDTAGKPTAYHVDYSPASPTMYLFPIPDAIYGIHYSADCEFAQVTNLASTPDIPTNWYSAVIHNVMAIWATTFPNIAMNRIQLWVSIANEEIKKIVGNDSRRNARRLQPSGKVV